MSIIFFIFSFIFAIITAFYVPGRVILGNKTMSLISKIAVSIVIGMVLWAFQGLVFGYMHQRWLSYPYLVVFLLFFWHLGYYKTSLDIKRWKIDIPAIVIVMIGVIGQIFPFFRVGWSAAKGVVIVASNPNDHIWHAALIKELVKRFTPNEPSIAGVPLKDYHYFYNLVTADLIRVFHLSFFPTQFDGMYILAPVIFGVLSYSIAQNIWKSKLFTRLFLFLIFFGGNAAGWIMLILRHTFTWNLSSLIIDSTKFIDSPPYSYAMIAGLTGFYLLLLSKGQLSKRLVFILTLLFGSLLELKVHVGIPFLFGFGIYSLGFLFKKNITPFIAFCLSGVLAFVLLKLGSSSTAGIIFLPIDIPRDFITQPVLHLNDWQLRWIIYQNHNNLLRLVEYGIFIAGFYLLVQFGLLLLGLIPFPSLVRKLGFQNSGFLYGVVVSSFILGLFFFQTVGGANIWEFFLAAFPILCLLTALFVATLIEKKPIFVRIIIVVLIIIIAIPQWINSINQYFKEQFLKGFYGVTNAQVESFEYLNKNTPESSVIFLANQSSYTYASTANLFIDRDLYLSGNGVRQIITPEIAKRRNEVESVSNSKISSEIGIILRTENIKYVYFYGKPKFPRVLEQANLSIVFANKAATIFQVK